MRLLLLRFIPRWPRPLPPRHSLNPLLPISQNLLLFTSAPSRFSALCDHCKGSLHLRRCLAAAVAWSVSSPSKNSGGEGGQSCRENANDALSRHFCGIFRVTDVRPRCSCSAPAKSAPVFLPVLKRVQNLPKRRRHESFGCFHNWSLFTLS